MWLFFSNSKIIGVFQVHIPFTLLFHPFVSLSPGPVSSHFWWVLYPANVSLWVQWSLGLGLYFGGMCCPSSMGDRWVNKNLYNCQVIRDYHRDPPSVDLGEASWGLLPELCVHGEEEKCSSGSFSFFLFICLDYFLRFLSGEVVPGCETSSPLASRSESMGLSLNFGLRKSSCQNPGI